VILLYLQELEILFHLQRESRQKEGQGGKDRPSRTKE